MTAASPLPISMSEYLHARYEPDCDYVDGLVENRNADEPGHRKSQKALVDYFDERRAEWGVYGQSEVRIQTSASHVRVADIAVLPTGEQVGEVLEKPPIAVVEILSPEGSSPRHSERIEDFRRMGTKSIWVVDPAARKGFDCSSGAWVETEHFAAAGSPVRIDLSKFFAAVDAGRA